MADEQDVEWRAATLASDVEARREDAEREAKLTSGFLEPRIAAHLDGAEKALEVVAAAERYICDKTDLDLSGDSRQVAVWMLVGRLVSLGRASLALLRQGFCAEVAPILRVMHETTRILHAVADPEEAELLKRWLEDETHVRPKHARKAGDRTRLRQASTIEELLARARAAGAGELASQLEAALEKLDLDVGEDFLEGISLQVYDTLSRISHSRRSGLEDGVSVPLRTIVMGPHPDPTIRASYVLFAGELIEEALIACSDGLSTAFWPGYHSQQIQPLIDALRELRAAHPLE